MTTATGLKRLGFVLLAVIAGGLAVLTTAGYLISADTVRQQVLAEIREVTGLDPVLRGKASVSLFPSGSVNFADVALGDTEAARPYRRTVDGTFAVFPTADWSRRDCRRFARSSENHDRLSAERPIQLVGPDRGIDAQPGGGASGRCVFRNAHRRRHCDNSRRSMATQRDIVRCGIFAGLAVDLEDASAPPVGSSGTMRPWTRA